MKFETNFKWDDFEKEIRRTVADDLEKHPEQVLKHHIGETYDGECPHCGHTKVTIVSAEQVRCNSCNKVSQACLDVKWR